MQPGRIAFLVCALVALGQTGCCHWWHHHCCYPPAECRPVVTAPAAVVVPAGPAVPPQGPIALPQDARQ
jgi:hypothetical protein